MDDLLSYIKPNEANKYDFRYLMKDSKPIENVVKGLLAMYIHTNLKHRYRIHVPYHMIDIQIKDMEFDEFNQLKSFKVIPEYGILNKYKKQIDTLIMEVLENGSIRNY